MKRVLTIAVLTLAIGLFSSAAFAAKGDKAGKGNKGAKASAGSVVKVDGTNLVIKTKKDNAEVTIATDATTKFEINGVPGTLADVKAGMKVTATPSVGTAEKVVATGGAKAGKGGKKNKNK